MTRPSQVAICEHSDGVGPPLAPASVLSTFLAADGLNQVVARALTAAALPVDYVPPQSGDGFDDGAAVTVAASPRADPGVRGSATAVMREMFQGCIDALVALSTIGPRELKADSTAFGSIVVPSAAHADIVAGSRRASIAGASSAGTKVSSIVATAVAATGGDTSKSVSTPPAASMRPVKGRLTALFSLHSSAPEHESPTRAAVASPAHTTAPRRHYDANGQAAFFTYGPRVRTVAAFSSIAMIVRELWRLLPTPMPTSLVTPRVGAADVSESAGPGEGTEDAVVTAWVTELQVLAIQGLGAVFSAHPSNFMLLQVGPDAARRRWHGTLFTLPCRRHRACLQRFPTS